MNKLSVRAKCWPPAWMASRTDRHNLVTISSCAYLVWMFCLLRDVLALVETNPRSLIILCIVICSRGAKANESAAKTRKLRLQWCLKSCEKSTLMLLFTAALFLVLFSLRCVDEQLWDLVFIDDISPLCPETRGTRISAAGLFCAEPLLSTAVAWFKRPPVDVLRSLHYCITVQPAAAASVTCFSILICSATWYSFSALLHLIRTGCVPPNNGIMTGTGWFLVLSASWPSARALEWESLPSQMWHSYECQGLLVLIGYPRHLMDSVGALD